MIHAMFVGTEGVFVRARGGFARTEGSTVCTGGVLGGGTDGCEIAGLAAATGPIRQVLRGFAVGLLLFTALTLLRGTTSTAGAQQVEWAQREGSGPLGRRFHAMAYDTARGVTVLFGGQNQNSLNAETWEWNGTTWNQRDVSGPSARHIHAMAYDSVRGVTVLFGGYTNNDINAETWEWNGTAWTQRLVSGPSGRYGHAMAFDAARGVTVLFGGGINSATNHFNAETWEWNGTSWTQRFVSGPPGVTYHVMAYDSARGRTVFFGGVWATADAGTWEWDGNAWTQAVVTGPSGRVGGAMAYDASRGVTVLFGGIANGDITAETWDWSGVAWTQRLVSGPSDRIHHAMAYDTARGVTVLFGGDGSSGYVSETWELGRPCSPPTISTNPTATNICRTTVATLNVSAAATTPITYRWRKAGVPIDIVANPSAATDTLRLVRVQTSDAGLYDCIVTTDCGSVTSAAARLTVRTCICLEADIAGGGDAGNEPDGTVDGTDFIAFINSFAIGDATVDPLADIAGGGDTGLEPDGTIDGTDFIFFINAFAIGC
jgi:hypothetical protein